MSDAPSSPSENAPRLTGREGRSLARLAAVQALYQMELGGQPVESVIDEFRTHRMRVIPDAMKPRVDRDAVVAADEKNDLTGADGNYFAAIVAGAVNNQEAIDRALHTSLSNGWTLARLDATLRALLRSAAYELMEEKSVPVAVVINEYVNLAHAFFGGEEPGLVHAMLDRLGKDVRST